MQLEQLSPAYAHFLQNASPNCGFKYRKLQMQFCTGLGQRDSHAIKLRDGSDNTHPKAGTPYRTICFEDIVAMTQRPPVAAKGAGRWVLASSYAECDARTFAVQAERGSYGMFVVDVDKGNHPFETVRDCSMALLPGQRLLINSTPSAKPEDKRWRIMAPLGMVIPDTVPQRSTDLPRCPATAGGLLRMGRGAW